MKLALRQLWVLLRLVARAYWRDPLGVWALLYARWFGTPVARQRAAERVAKAGGEHVPTASATGLAEEVSRQLAIIHTQHRRPTRVRMHPLDIEWCRRVYVPSADPFEAINRGGTLLGVPVEADDACQRGHPEADYE